MTEFIGLPNLPRYWLIDMYTICTVKDCILKSFTDPSSKLRIVIVTVAFGMGLDCLHIRRIIHEIGRDSKTASAVLYYTRKQIGYDFVDTSKKEYCQNKDECRRVTLYYKDFDGIVLLPFWFLPKKKKTQQH